MSKHGRIIIKLKDMSELEKNYKIRLFYVICFLVLSLASCNRWRHFYTRGGETFCHCQMAYNGQDTVHLDSKRVCVFKNSILQASGNIKDGRRKGDWYIYQSYPDTLECSTVMRYRRNDSIRIWTRGLVNDSW